LEREPLPERRAKYAELADAPCYIAGTDTELDLSCPPDLTPKQFCERVTRDVESAGSRMNPPITSLYGTSLLLIVNNGSKDRDAAIYHAIYSMCKGPDYFIGIETYRGQRLKRPQFSIYPFTSEPKNHSLSVFDTWKSYKPCRHIIVSALEQSQLGQAKTYPDSQRLTEYKWIGHRLLPTDYRG